jgi:hypothetical protein
MSSKTTVPSAVAKLAPVGSKQPQMLVSSTEEQASKIQQAPAWASQPAVQAIVKVTLTDTTGLDATLKSLANARALVVQLEGTRDAQVATILRDRRNLEGAITTAAAGDPAQVAAWGCQVVTKAVVPATNAAPVNVTAKPSKHVLGAVTARCKAVRGASYLWIMGVDATPALTAQPTVTQVATLTVTGQPLGHTLYFRVAVIRRSGGQSLWSDAAEVVVR